MCFNYELNIDLLTFLLKKNTFVDFVQFIMHFSHLYGHISETRVLPDVCNMSNFSSDLGLKSREFFKKSSEPFPRKWPKSAWPNGHFFVFWSKGHVNLIILNFIMSHLKACLNTFSTIPICMGSVNWFGHSGHLKIGHFWPSGGRPQPRWRPNQKVPEQKSLSFYGTSKPESLKEIRNNYVQTDTQTKPLSQISDGDAGIFFQNAITFERVVRF